MLLIAFYSILFLQDAELENRFATEHPYRAIFYAIVSVLITFIIIMVISRANIFSTTISILIEIVYPVLYAVLGFVLLIKDSIMKYTINKIYFIENLSWGLYPLKTITFPWFSHYIILIHSI